MINEYIADYYKNKFELFNSNINIKFTKYKDIVFSNDKYHATVVIADNYIQYRECKYDLCTLNDDDLDCIFQHFISRYLLNEFHYHSSNSYLTNAGNINVYDFVNIKVGQFILIKLMNGTSFTTTDISDNNIRRIASNVISEILFCHDNFPMITSQ